MRIACYNVEWFDRLFDDEGQLQRDSRWPGRRDVKRADQAKALGHVFRRIDADAIMVIEALDDHQHRSCKWALENFAKPYDLFARKALIGFINTAQQEIALLYDPTKLTATNDPIGTLCRPSMRPTKLIWTSIIGPTACVFLSLLSSLRLKRQRATNCV